MSKNKKNYDEYEIQVDGIMKTVRSSTNVLSIIDAEKKDEASKMKDTLNSMDRGIERDQLRDKMLKVRAESNLFSFGMKDYKKELNKIRNNYLSSKETCSCCDKKITVDTGKTFDIKSYKMRKTVLDRILKKGGNNVIDNLKKEFSTLNTEVKILCDDCDKFFKYIKTVESTGSGRKFVSLTNTKIIDILRDKVGHSKNLKTYVQFISSYLLLDRLDQKGYSYWRKGDNSIIDTYADKLIKHLDSSIPKNENLLSVEKNLHDADGKVQSEIDDLQKQIDDLTQKKIDIQNEHLNKVSEARIKHMEEHLEMWADKDFCPPTKYGYDNKDIDYKKLQEKVFLKVCEK